jgi:hypothetical protein
MINGITIFQSHYNSQQPVIKQHTFLFEMFCHKISFKSDLLENNDANCDNIKFISGITARVEYLNNPKTNE